MTRAHSTKKAPQKLKIAFTNHFSLSLLQEMKLLFICNIYFLSGPHAPQDQVFLSLLVCQPNFGQLLYSRKEPIFFSALNFAPFLSGSSQISELFFSLHSSWLFQRLYPRLSSWKMARCDNDGLQTKGAPSLSWDQLKAVKLVLMSHDKNVKLSRKNWWTNFLIWWKSSNRSSE